MKTVQMIKEKPINDQNFWQWDIFFITRLFRFLKNQISENSNSNSSGMIEN